MTFSANPFDYSGHLDTSAPDGQKSGFATVGTGGVSTPGETLGAKSTVTADNSASEVVAAFRDGTLSADAANRDQPGQAIPSPSAP